MKAAMQATRSAGAGLAPQSRRGIDALTALTPMEDLRVFGPLRAVRHRAWTERRDVTPKELDEALPLMAQGLLDVLRMHRDGLVSRSVDLDLDDDSPVAGVLEGKP